MHFWPKGYNFTYYFNETDTIPSLSSNQIRFAARTYQPYVSVTHNYIIGEEDERESSFNVVGPLYSVIVECAKKGNLR